MPLFHSLIFEPTVQVDDKFRIKSACYASGGSSITSVEVEPEAGAGYTNITSVGYIDWQYTTAGTKTISVKLNAGSPKTYSVTCVTAATDNLFSSDEDLIAHETNIMNFLPDGKNSWKMHHRRVQGIIMDEIAKRGYRNNDGNKYTAADVLDILEVKEWATFKVLAVIMGGLSNAVDDVFAQKSMDYEKKSVDASNRAYLALDRDGDDALSTAEKLAPFNEIVVKRR